MCAHFGRSESDLTHTHIIELTESCGRYSDYPSQSARHTWPPRALQCSNQWVVPYCPWLTCRYDAHVNVEYCASIKAVKYLYKYIFKGSSSQIGNPNQQHVHFVDGHFMDAMMRGPPVTKLTAYLQTNSPDHPDYALTCTLLYPEFPKYFTWTKNQGGYVWSRRRSPSSTTIGRLWMAQPGGRERFYLRLLLHHIRGAQSFVHMRTVNGVVHDTFRDACLALNRLQSDEEWDRCLTEASLASTASSLRALFTTLLIFCEPGNPSQLLTDHVTSLAGDVEFFLQSNPLVGPPQNELRDFLILCILHDVSGRLLLHSRALSDFALDTTYDRLIRTFSNYDVDNILYHHNPSTNTAISRQELASLVTSQELSLTQDQRAVYNVLCNKIDRNQGGFIYIDAPGGTGKTYLVNLLINRAELRRQKSLACASSGIASTLLKGGRTAHSLLKLPIPATPDSVCNFTPRSQAGKTLMHANFIVWDEAPMMHRWSLEALDRSLRDLLRSNRPFGGKLLILAGDFRQVTPVLRRAGRPQIVNACICKSPLWSSVTKLRLTTNMRCHSIANDSNYHRITSYSKWLLQLGNGSLPTPLPFTRESGIISLPPCITLTEASSESLIDFVYSDITNNSSYTNPDWFHDRAILSPTNSVIDEMNHKIINRIPGRLFTLPSADSVSDSENSLPIPIEFLNSITPSGLPPHILHLKVHTPIMLLRNLDPKNGHCNGSRYTINEFIGSPVRIIRATMLGGPHSGEQILIPRIGLIPSDSDLPFSFVRRQFPVRASLCVTINKAQGQSLKKLGVYLPQPAFNHGHLYVAACRVGDPSHIKFAVDQSPYIDSQQITTHSPVSSVSQLAASTFTTDVVYHEIVA